MPAVIVLEIVADRGDFGLLVTRPVVGRGRIVGEREPSGRDDIDKIIGDWPILRIDQKIALEISAAENDQITERQRQPDEADRSRGGKRRR